MPSAPPELGLLLLSRHLRVLWANRLMAEYFGVPRDELARGHARTLVQGAIGNAIERPDRFAKALLGGYADRRHLAGLTCHVLPGAGRPERWLEYSSRPICGGKRAGQRLECFLDVTGERAPGERARRRNASPRGGARERSSAALPAGTSRGQQREA
jgi:PAS domain-containing protein